MTESRMEHPQGRIPVVPAASGPPPVLTLVSARSTRYAYESSIHARLKQVLGEFPFESVISSDQVVPVKMHLGSHGAVQTVRSAYVALVVERLLKVPCRPFVTDSARISAWKYLEVARRNGYSFDTLGAPVVIADGIYGRDNLPVKAGRLLGEVSVASAIHDAPAMVVITHVKGHNAAGFGGAVKNLAMGGVSFQPRGQGWDKGRGKAHFLLGTLVEWQGDLCSLCGTCSSICPLDAIEEISGEINIQDDKCWRCGRCIRSCPSGALSTPSDDAIFQEALAEQAVATLSTFEPGRVVYLNFLLDLQPECDCAEAHDVPVVQDIGVLVGTDPVAIDCASLDLVAKEPTLPSSAAADLKLEPGQDVFSALHLKNPRTALAFCAQAGLGRLDYELRRC